MIGRITFSTLGKSCLHTRPIFLNDQRTARESVGGQLPAQVKEFLGQFEKVASSCFRRDGSQLASVLSTQDACEVVSVVPVWIFPKHRQAQLGRGLVNPSRSIMTTILNKNPVTASHVVIEEPYFVTVDNWCSRTGISKSDTYRKLGAGILRAKKVGRRTLIDFQHGLAWLRARPDAEITTTK